MPEITWALKEIKRLRRSHVVMYGVMSVCVAISIVCSNGWWTSSERLSSAKRIIASQQRSLEVQEMQAHATATLLRKEQAAAGKYEVGSMSKGEQIKALERQVDALGRKISVEQGKRGPMQRKINEQAHYICSLEQMLRDNGVRLYMDPKCGGGAK